MMLILFMFIYGCSVSPSGDGEDGDIAGVTVNPTSGLVTTEGGGTDTFTAVLKAAPDSDVVIDISSSDETEGTVSPSSLTFTSNDWDTAQTVTVTGVNDWLNDGDVAYTIVLAIASSKSDYTGVNPDDVSVSNTDTTPLLIATNRLGDILLVNQTTGEVTELLDVYTNSSGTNVGVITSMAYDASNDTLYGGTGGSVSPNNGCIYTIDLSTGKATLLGDTGLWALPGMALRASDGAIFTSLYNFFYRIDPVDVTSPTELNDSISYSTGAGMTYDLSGTLYIANGDGGDIITLYTLNDTTGAETTLGALTYPNLADFNAIDPQFPVYSRITCMTNRFDGQIFGILTDEPYSYLVTVDPATVSAELVGRTGNKLAGLVMLPLSNRPPALAPATPKNLDALSGNQCVLLGWDDAFTAKSYNIYWSTAPGVTPSNGTLISGITSTFYSHPVASDGTTYYYVVTAVNDIGESAPTSEVSATVGNIGATAIDFAPETGPFANDVTASLTGAGSVTGTLDIGFSFDFFGITYTQFKISSYGMITFDLTFPGGTTGYGKSIPVSDPYDDIIAFAWRRLDVDQGGTISYETRGTAPNRRLIVAFDRVATRYGFGVVTTQLILYETSNLIEIHTTNLEKGATANGDYTTQGVENATGSLAYFFPGRVADVFWLKNDAVRFDTNLID